MRITIVGAAGGEVTGSAHYVRTEHAGVLVDAGMFQGGRKSEALNRSPTGPRQRLDAVLLTHAHLDHTGRLPILAKRGHDMPVYATPATIEVATLVLRDAVGLQASDLKRRNRIRARAGEPPLDPLYSSEHVEAAIEMFRPVPYEEEVSVAPGIRAMWHESGHMLGSASIRLSVEEGGQTKRVVFSGDVGPLGVPILKNFEPFHRADLVFLESTYGDRDHRPFAETAEEFVSLIKEAVSDGGRILVPTFAIGRAQLLTGLLAWMFRKGYVDRFPIFLDSPMAIETTEVYAQHRELFDEGMTRFISEKPLREDLVTLKMCATRPESRQINDQSGPFLVMAGAGMCNGGRILNHLRNNLWRPETHVVFVGYQGHGSLGRRLVDGAGRVTIYGEKIAVKARVHTLGGFSAHAGQSDLLDWLSTMVPAKPRVVLVHGENRSRVALAERIEERFALAPVMPGMREIVEI